MGNSIYLKLQWCNIQDIKRCNPAPELPLALTVLNISCLLIKLHKCLFILLDVDMETCRVTILPNLSIKLLV